VMKLFEQVLDFFPIPLNPAPVKHPLQNLGTFGEAG